MDFGTDDLLERARRYSVPAFATISMTIKPTISRARKAIICSVSAHGHPVPSPTNDEPVADAAHRVDAGVRRQLLA